jgi:hypothetical protein
LPTLLGIRPKIGPPKSAEAGVVSVRFAPSSSTPTQFKGVIPWTCALAGAAGSRAIPLTTASAAISALARLRAELLLVIRATLLCLVRNIEVLRIGSARDCASESVVRARPALTNGIPMTARSSKGQIYLDWRKALEAAGLSE